MMVNVVPILHTYLGGYAKIVLIWGLFLVLYDLIRIRGIVYTPHYKWLLLFILLYFVSIFVNFKNGFIENLSSFLYCIIPLLLLYPHFATASKDEMIREARIYAMVFFVFTFICCFISVIMFSKQYFILFNGEYRTGVHWGRLYGIYKSPNSGSLYAFLSILLLLFWAKTCKKNTIIQKILYGIIIVINTMYFVLADSNGTNVALYCFIGILVFLLVLTTVKRFKPVKKILKVIAAIVLSAVMVCASYYSTKALGSAFSYIPSIISALSPGEKQGKPAPPPGQPQKTAAPKSDSSEKDSGLSSVPTERTYKATFISGRPDMWLMGARIIMKYPMFGVGYGDYYEISKSISPTPSNPAVSSGFHNLFIQIAATCGLPCLIAFCIYLTDMGVHILKRIKRQLTTLPKVHFIIGASLLAALLMNNLAEVSITIYYSGIGLVFWAVLGCLVNKNRIIQENENLELQYEKGAVAFFAATPYQVLNTINIRTHCFKDSSADLYIMDYATDTSECYNAVKDSGVFQNVYAIKDPWNKKGRLRFLRSYIVPAQRIMKIISYKKYNAMFGTRIGMANNFYYTHLIKNNKDMAFHYYEEGIGDYILEITPPDTLLVRLSRVIGYRNAFERVANLWLYKPEFRKQNLQYDACAIPAIDSETSRLFMDIFNGTQEAKSYIPENCKVLYFDQAYKEQLDIDFDNIRVLDLIREVVDEKDIYIKLHPGSEKDKYANTGLHLLPPAPLPWEVQLSNVALENILLVSINSTAVITPIIMYNKAVTVILLYKCFPDSRFINMDKQEAYFNHIKNENGNGKLYIPENTSELIETIRKWMAEVNQ